MRYFSDNFAVIELDIISSNSDMEIVIPRDTLHVSPGDTLTMLPTITNLGIGKSGDLILEYSLSTDSLMDESDLVLDQVSISALYPATIINGVYF